MSKTETGQLAPKLQENPEITGDARIDELLWRLRASGLGKSVSASEWEEVQEHLIENLLTDERITKEYNAGYRTGQENARDLAETYILDAASEFFKTGKDDERAKQLRNLATKVKDHVTSFVRK